MSARAQDAANGGGARLLQRYVPARELGAGACARTHLAVHHSGAGMRRLVAVKLIHRRIAANPTAAVALLERCRVAAAVPHHNLAGVLEQGSESGKLIVVTDYVVGENLLSVLARCVRLREPVPLPLAVRIVADTCAALSAAHGCGDPQGRIRSLIHGAVRPCNMMVSYAGCPVLCDLGLTAPEGGSVAAGLSPTQAHFAAPEVLDGQPADPRSDVYSTGAVLYALVTLRFPHDAYRSVADIAAAKRRDPPVPPSRRTSTVPADLEHVIVRALDRDASRRHRSATELATDLEQVLARHGAPAGGLDLASYLGKMFGGRIRAKQRALRTLLATPPGVAIAQDTIVEVVDEETLRPGVGHLLAQDDATFPSEPYAGHRSDDNVLGAPLGDSTLPHAQDFDEPDTDVTEVADTFDEARSDALTGALDAEEHDTDADARSRHTVDRKRRRRR